MTTMTTETVRVTIDAPFAEVARDLADPAALVEWGSEFFSGPPRPLSTHEVEVTVPRMGGEARMKVDADVECGRIDLYLAPVGHPYGSPLPVRVLPNGGGVDVLFTLARLPGQSEGEWQEGLASMRRELENLRKRHES